MWRTEALRNVNLLHLHQLTMVERRSWRLEEEAEEEVGEQEEDESLDGKKMQMRSSLMIDDDESLTMMIDDNTLTMASRRLSHLSFLLQATWDSAESRKTKSRIP